MQPARQPGLSQLSTGGEASLVAKYPLQDTEKLTSSHWLQGALAAVCSLFAKADTDLGAWDPRCGLQLVGPGEPRISFRAAEGTSFSKVRTHPRSQSL